MNAEQELIEKDSDLEALRRILNESPSKNLVTAMSEVVALVKLGECEVQLNIMFSVSSNS